MGRMSSDHKLAQKILDGLNVLDVDPVRVAALLSLAGPTMQVRLYKMCMKLLYNWAVIYDTNHFPDEMIDVVVSSKRIVEAFEKRGGVYPN